MLMLVVLVLVTGYIVCSESLHYKFKLHRFEGQLLYLKCAKVGVETVLIAWVLQGATYWVAKSLGLEVPALRPYGIGQTPREASPYAVLVALTVLVAFLRIYLPKLHQQVVANAAKKLGVFSKGDVIELAAKQDAIKHLPLQLMIYKAYLTEALVMIILSDHKVYVGFLADVGEPTESEPGAVELAIVPTLSGYRNQNDLSLHFTVTYLKHHDDLSIALRGENIVSCREFDFHMYKDFVATGCIGLSNPIPTVNAGG